MKTYVINLKQSTKRRKFQEIQLKELGIQFTLINAVSVDDISHKTYKQHHHDWVRPMRKTEVACYFSHRKAWKMVMESDRPALILEDDALLSKNTKDLIEILSKRTDTDLITLEIRARKKFLSRKFTKLNTGFNLVRLYQDRTGAAAYVLFPSGAKKLIECETKKGIAIADAHITGCSTINAYQIEPAAAIQLDVCPLYGINHKTSHDIDSAISSISVTSKHKGKMSFRIKRIISQIRLGFRQLFLFTISTRRFVKFNKSEFQKPI